MQLKNIKSISSGLSYQSSSFLLNGGAAALSVNVQTFCANVDSTTIYIISIKKHTPMYQQRKKTNKIGAEFCICFWAILFFSLLFVSNEHTQLCAPLWPNQCLMWNNYLQRI